MNRKFYIDLAAKGCPMPIGADLVLREHADHDAILREGRKLGKILEEAALRYKSPFALPVMDLALEKSAMLQMLGIPADQVDTYHFHECPTDEMALAVEQHLNDPYDRRLQANIDAVAYTAWQTKLIPVGMSIGPFSLMTKLLADPITPLYIAGTGATSSDDPEVKMVERTLELSTRIILRSISAQIRAGAKAIFLAEPAANKAYISPNQIEAGSDIFDRYVMKYNQQIKSLLNAWGVDLFFHCCGELTDYMVKKFTELDPAILSLGSSRHLWEDARLVPQRVVLYGNLPSKKFYSDELLSVDQVRQMAMDLADRMSHTGHPFILGTECDVLTVPGHEKSIKAKMNAILDCHHEITIARAG